MSDNRVRIWFSVFVLVVFCVGLGGGILIGRRMGPPPPFARPAGFGAIFGGRTGGPPARERLIERISAEVQLSNDQRRQVEAILDAHRGKLEQIHRDVISRAEAEQQGMQAEIRKVLTPDQQQRFDKWLASRRGPFGRGMRGFGPRGSE